MPPPRTFPAYLFFGNQTDRILKERDQVIAQSIPPEMRAESLTEHFPTGMAPTVKLTELFDEIAGDLATISMFPDAKKAVVVTNPAELGESSGARRGAAPGKKAKSATPVDRIAHWIERELSETGHLLILLYFEDESAGREVDEKSPLYGAIGRIGHVRKFRDDKAFYRIEDALIGRNANACLTAIDDLWGNGKGDQMVYSALVRTLRFLLQANIIDRDRKPGGTQHKFSQERQRDLAAAAPFVQKKYAGRPAYRTADLLAAYNGMLDVYRAMRPRPEDFYVPDAHGLVRQTVLRLMTAPRAR